MYQMNHTRFSHLLIPLFLLFIALIGLNPCSAQCNPRDQKALLQIKNQFGNPQSLESWDPNTDCCNDWSGYMYADVRVNCDGQGNVIELTIDGADDITSEIPSALGDLSSLQILKLYNIPHLSGQIPASAICKLTNVWSLTLAYGNVSGSIPECLGQLNQVTYIELSGNNLSGHIPSALVQLPYLQELHLMHNKLDGPFPDFPNQRHIYNINLYNNKLSGPLPASLGLLSNLSMLSLAGNKLNGSLLPSIGQLSNLQWLDLSNNQFSGSIPDSFGSLVDTTIYLQLQGNQLTGQIPKSLGNLYPIWMDLSNNRLRGDASFLFGFDKYWPEKIILNNNLLKFNFTNVVLPQNLRTLNVSHNKIYGSVTEQMARLWSLDVSYNRLCGAIPSGCEKFGPRSFSHNTCLCGPPLKACK